ncbi:hypothetical protein ON010_g2231 [Phytophthora cinnamomi]|nr:hypothetical protein ON010_g2231 [Phytophthora cinnamomi]
MIIASSTEARSFAHQGAEQKSLVLTRVGQVSEELQDVAIPLPRGRKSPVAAAQASSESACLQRINYPSRLDETRIIEIGKPNSKTGTTGIS